jgi:hypothetical protein
LSRRDAVSRAAPERLHGDDTHVPILAKGKSIKGHIWTYVRDDRPSGDPLQELFEEIDALNRKRIYRQVPNEPAEAGPKAAPA